METWTMLRFVLGYPLAIVAGAIWAIGFGARWWLSPVGGRDGAAGWAALAGGGVAFYGLAGLISLWVSDTIGLGQVTSAIITLGQAVLVGTVTAGALWVARRSWLQRA